jgi:hypothetical protein
MLVGARHKVSVGEVESNFKQEVGKPLLLIQGADLMFIIG